MISIVLKFLGRYWPFILLGIAGAVIYFLLNSIEKVKEQKAALMMDKIIASDSLVKVVDELGREHAKAYVLEVTNNGLNALIDSKDQYILNILNQNDIKKKNLLSATHLETVTKKTFTIPLKPNPSDSIPFRKQIEYSDPWFSISGLVTSDSVTITPAFLNTQDIIFHRERRKKKYLFDWIRPKVLTAEVINHNPYSSTKSLKVVYIGK
jgi:hypothetical protein